MPIRHFVLLSLLFTACRDLLAPNPDLFDADLDVATLQTNYEYELPYNAHDFEFVCNLKEGDLPEGITVRDDCVVEGIPTEEGIFSFTVELVVTVCDGTVDETTSSTDHDCSEKSTEHDYVLEVIN